MAILVSIFMVIRVVSILRQAVEGNLPIDSVLTLLMLKLMTNIDLLIPLVVFVSVLLVLNRWARDHEMIVIQACGVSIKTFLKPGMLLALFLGAVTALFSLYIGPLSNQVARTIEQNFKNRNDIAGVVPGVFTETRNGTGVYFVEQYNEELKQYRDVFVFDGGGEDGGVVVANSGFKTLDKITGDEFLVLKDGTRYEGNPGDQNYSVLDFETYALRLKENSKAEFDLPVKAQPTFSLLSSTHRSAIGELHWRLAHVLAIPIMLLMALSFSAVYYRQTKLPSMLLALLMYFAYLNALGVMVALIRKGNMPPHISMYIVHFIFASIAVYRFNCRAADKPLIPNFKAR